MSDIHVTIDQFWLSFVIGTVLPAATALITKRLASGAVKAVVLTLLAVVTGWATSLQATGGQFELKAALIGIATTFITAVAAHFGLLKPLNITGSGGVIQRAIPGGIGSSNSGKPQTPAVTTYDRGIVE